MEFKRISMNTSLKNARIFDDDSWDAETAGLIVKKEPSDFENPENQYSSNSNNSHHEDHFTDIKIKTEIKAEPNNENNWSRQKVKFEQDVEHYEEINSVSKVEMKKVDTNEDTSGESTNDKFEESYLDNIDDDLRAKILNTPNKSDIRNDILLEDSNPSPFNKELFRNFNLGQGYGSPEQQSSKYETRKSIKRSVFTRLSPYKKYTAEEAPANTQAVKKRLGAQTSSEIPRKKPKKPDPETDPEVLARRQKQIDFGKNTIGYDNYLKTIPKQERTRDDPQTPNKFVKYSRRGWDGLIKQWRLKLHKYDSADD